jgi:hypothetical protein
MPVLPARRSVRIARCLPWWRGRGTGVTFSTRVPSGVHARKRNRVCLPTAGSRERYPVTDDLPDGCANHQATDGNSRLDARLDEYLNNGNSNSNLSRRINEVRRGIADVREKIRVAAGEADGIF